MRRAIRNACENRTDRGELETVPHFIPAGNEPSGHACIHIWRLPQGSIPRSSAALQV